MSQHYSDPTRENDTWSLPDVEVFYVSKGEARENAAGDSEGEEASPMTEAGWYYWFCFPGCMPDSEAEGPFGTEDEALADAREMSE